MAQLLSVRSSYTWMIKLVIVLTIVIGW